MTLRCEDAEIVVPVATLCNDLESRSVSGVSSDDSELSLLIKVPA